MTTAFRADVVVVGAGTSGCYFAWRLAQAGYRVLVLEKRALADICRPGMRSAIPDYVHADCAQEADKADFG